METAPDEQLVSIVEAVTELSRDYPSVTHSSLRFFERACLVTPTRTPGGHRLFSRADLDRVRQIKLWQAQRLSLDEIRRRLSTQASLESRRSLAGQFRSLAVAGNPAARRYILELDDAGMPLARLLQEVLRPALIEVGQQWKHGTLGVGQEHEVTELAKELIAELASRHLHPQPTGRPVLAAGVAGERHDVGLRMLVALLRAEGRIVHFLGPDVDARFLREETARREPGLVLLSVTIPDHLTAVANAVAALNPVSPPGFAGVLCGGQAVEGNEALVRTMGALPLDGSDLVQATRAIGQLVNGEPVTWPG